MKAKLIKIQERASRFGGVFYYIFFKNGESQAFKTCIYPAFGNYQRWKPIIEEFYKNQREIWLDGLNLKGERLVDGDSLFKVIENANA